MRLKAKAKLYTPYSPDTFQSNHTLHLHQVILFFLKRSMQLLVLEYRINQIIMQNEMR